MRSVHFYFLLLISAVSLTESSHSQVAEVWTSVYNNAYDSTDEGYYIIRGDSSSVIVSGVTISSPSTGYDATLTKYDRNGVMLWQTIFSGQQGYYNVDVPQGIVSDAEGNIYVVVQAILSEQTKKLYLIKYNLAGIQIWLRSFELSGFIASGNGKLAMDNLGNPVMSFTYLDSANLGNGRIATVKYNSNGVILWSRFFDGPVTGGHDDARAIITDAQNNVYVALASDSTFNSSYYRNICLVKYNSLGVLQWIKRQANVSGGHEIPSDIALDAQGNIYVTGQRTDFLMITSKYNTSGTLLWTKYRNHSNAHDIETDASGFFYLYGRGAFSTFLGKYNSDGDSIWVRTNTSVESRDSYGNSLSVDGLGNIYISGRSWLNNPYKSYAAKYNIYGDPVWALTYEGNWQSLAHSHIIDNNGNMYITGRSARLNADAYDMLTMLYTQSPYFITEYSRNGLNLLINDNQYTADTLFVNCTDNSQYLIHDINLEIDTVLHTNVSDLEFYLNHNGITDTLIFRAGGNGDNFVRTVLNDSALQHVNNGTAPFTGTFKPQNPLSLFNGVPANGDWILRIYDRATGNTGVLKHWSMKVILSTNPLGFTNLNNGIPVKFSLSQNYPNPFNPATSFEFSVPQKSFVNLEIFDVLGRKIETLINGELKPGTYKTEWNASKYPSGVYFYRLVAGNISETKKMILLK